MTTKHVLITRPASQGNTLFVQLSKAGYQVTHVPVMELAALDEPDQQRHIEKTFSGNGTCDGIIFVSVNAAEQALPWLKKFPVASTTPLFSVGRATALYLADNFSRANPIVYPQQEMSSEGLLALDEMQPAVVNGKQYLLLRGQGGRELISRELTARGARVDSCELYRRYVPRQNIPALKKSLPGVDVMIVSSGESLENLAAMAGSDLSEAMHHKTLMVPSERVANIARRLGFRHIINTANATDDAVIKALDQWNNS